MRFEQYILQIVHNANVRASVILTSFVSGDPVILTKAFVSPSPGWNQSHI